MTTLDRRLRDAGEEHFLLNDQKYIIDISAQEGYPYESYYILEEPLNMGEHYNVATGHYLVSVHALLDKDMEPGDQIAQLTQLGVPKEQLEMINRRVTKTRPASKINVPHRDGDSKINVPIHRDGDIDLFKDLEKVDFGRVQIGAARTKSAKISYKVKGLGLVDLDLLPLGRLGTIGDGRMNSSKFPAQ